MLGTKQNRWRIRIFMALVIYSLVTLGISLSSIPGYYQRVITHTIPDIVLGDTIQLSNEIIASSAAMRGMSLQTYAIYNITINLIITFGFVLVAALILIKARHDWFNWFTAWILIFYPQGSLYTFFRVAPPIADYISLGAILWPLYGLFLFLFPNGRAVPLWMRWPVGIYFVLHAGVQASALALNAGILPDSISQMINQYGGIILLVFPLTLIAQIYRYRRVSNIVERAQTRWFLLGFGAYTLFNVVVSLFTPAELLVDTQGYLGDVSNLMALFIPLSIGFAVLRYRLWDIDVIIRRTLVYSMLTATLGLVYFGSVVALQAVFQVISGSGSTLALVVSTLIIAALFNPLRQRLQSRIDYRFYRRKYDASQALDRFGDLTRSETDLERLTGRLVEVVDETVQPENVMLWMKKG